MKNIKEKLIVTGLKMRSNLMTSKEKSRTVLKDNKGSAVSYILILVAGVIITVVVMYPALNTLYETIASNLQDWWGRVTTKVFVETI